jgi:aminopeptidase
MDPRVHEILVQADRNTKETSDVDPKISTAYARANELVLAERIEKNWVITQHPAPGNAQEAEMSTGGYADFVYNAVAKDWEDQREFQIWT